jgi:adenylate cyclase
MGFMPLQLLIGIIYGVLISGAIGTFELRASSGPLRTGWEACPSPQALPSAARFMRP